MDPSLLDQREPTMEDPTLVPGLVLDPGHPSSQADTVMLDSTPAPEAGGMDLDDSASGAPTTGLSQQLTDCSLFPLPLLPPGLSFGLLPPLLPPAQTPPLSSSPCVPAPWTCPFGCAGKSWRLDSSSFLHVERVHLSSRESPST